jgi:hypothetical protein
MNRLAGNAVFLARGSPVRVLVYEGSASAASISGVDSAIAQVSLTIGRSWSRTRATAAEVPLQLASAESFVVLPQSAGSDSDLIALGTSWRLALREFLLGGGVVTLFDGPAGHEGTYQILEAAGLFAADGRTSIDLEVVELAAPGDAIAVDVPFRYRGELHTVWFETSERTAVVEHPSGPVVIHRVIPPEDLE